MSGERGDDVFQLMIFAEVAQRAFSGDGLDAAHARRDASFFQNFDQADLAGLRRVRTAAEFGGEISDLDHAHAVSILFAKESHRVILVDGDVDGDILDYFDALVA